MPKIALVSVPLSLRQRYGVMSQFIRRGVSTQPPLGLCYMATLLRRHGYDAHVVDAAATEATLEDTAQRLARGGFDYVGMSLPTVAVPNAIAIGEALKADNPRIKVIGGGPHASSMPEATLAASDVFDALVIGEGEHTVLELLQYMEEGGDLSGVNGLAFRHNGEVTRTPPRGRIRDLDALGMPDWSLLDETFHLYRLPLYSAARAPSFSLFTSRGCIGTCEFCARTVFGRVVTRHSPQYVARMIQELHRQRGVVHFHFQDDNFLLQRRWIETFLGLLPHVGRGISWSCAGRVDCVDPDLLKRLKHTGCTQIFYGLESGSQHILDLLQKNITSGQLARVLSATRAAGIATAANVMIGNPTEARHTLKLTQRFVNSIDLVGLSITFFTPFPGTTIRDRIDQFGTFEEDWARMSSYEPLFVPYGLTKDELLAACRHMYGMFYFRPRTVLNYLRRIGSFGKLMRMALGAVRLLLFSIWTRPWEADVPSPDRDASVRHAVKPMGSAAAPPTPIDQKART